MYQPPQGWDPNQGSPGPHPSSPHYPHYSGPALPSSAGPTPGDKRAELSLYLGLASLLCSVFTGIPAVILGATSLSAASPAGRPKAYVGMALGGVMSAAVVLVAVSSGGAQKSAGDLPTAPVRTPVEAPATPEASQRGASAPVVAAETAAPPPIPHPVEPERKGSYPTLVSKFHQMTELQQKKYAETFPDTVLSGAGKVFEVEKCGFLDDSRAHKRGCWKVILDDANDAEPRVALYYGTEHEDELAALKKGQRLSFKDCTGNSIKNWGFWSTATCDMP